MKAISEINIWYSCKDMYKTKKGTFKLSPEDVDGFFPPPALELLNKKEKRVLIYTFIITCALFLGAVTKLLW